MMSWWVPQVVGTLVSTQKAQFQKVEKVRYGKEQERESGFIWAIA